MSTENRTPAYAAAQAFEETSTAVEELHTSLTRVHQALEKVNSYIGLSMVNPDHLKEQLSDAIIRLSQMQLKESRPFWTVGEALKDSEGTVMLGKPVVYPYDSDLAKQSMKFLLRNSHSGAYAPAPGPLYTHEGHKSSMRTAVNYQQEKTKRFFQDLHNHTTRINQIVSSELDLNTEQMLSVSITPRDSFNVKEMKQILTGALRHHGDPTEANAMLWLFNHIGLSNVCNNQPSATLKCVSIRDEASLTPISKHWPTEVTFETHEDFTTRLYTYHNGDPASKVIQWLKVTPVNAFLNVPVDPVHFITLVNITMGYVDMDTNDCLTSKSIGISAGMDVASTLIPVLRDWKSKTDLSNDFGVLVQTPNPYQPLFDFTHQINDAIHSNLCLSPSADVNFEITPAHIPKPQDITNLFSGKVCDDVGLRYVIENLAKCGLILAQSDKSHLNCFSIQDSEALSPSSNYIRPKRSDDLAIKLYTYHNAEPGNTIFKWLSVTPLICEDGSVNVSVRSGLINLATGDLLGTGSANLTPASTVADLTAFLDRWAIETEDDQKPAQPVSFASMMQDGYEATRQMSNNPPFSKPKQ